MNALRSPLPLVLAFAFLACGGEDDELRSLRDRAEASGEVYGSCLPWTCGGEAAEGSCWCDPFCDAYGDCCSNKGEVCDRSTTFLSYNAGLAHGAVTFAEERVPRVIEALEANNADVVCLQEVWTDEDAEAIRSALLAQYPYSFREKTEDGSWSLLPRCAFWDVLPLKSCVSGCEEQGMSVFECVEDQCKEQYDELSDGCKLCLAANTTSPTSCATVGAADFSNEGRNGLLLLSNAPIKELSYTPFDTSLVKRGMINATIGDLRIQCTHMTSDLASVPYPEERPFQSWIEEHRAQVDLLAEAAPEGQCTVLLGDLNAGLREPAVSPELPFNFQALLDHGYSEPWESASCTFCQENPLAGSRKDLRLDHILFRNCPDGRSFWFRRVFDEAIELISDGRRYQTRISDHYGLEATRGGLPD